MRLIILFLCIIAFNGYAQESGEPQPRVLIKLAPLALIDDMSFPSVQTGVEVAITKKISWYNEVGIRYRKGLGEIYLDSSSVKPGGLKLKSEVRYYFAGESNQLHRLSGYYVALDLFYVKNTRNSRVYYRYMQDTTNFSTDEFGLKEKAYGCTLVAGNQIKRGNRFMFEWYVGFGLRIRDIASVNKEYVRERDTEARNHHLRLSDFMGGRYELIDGKRSGLNFSLGIRFAYRLF